MTMVARRLSGTPGMMLRHVVVSSVLEACSLGLKSGWSDWFFERKTLLNAWLIWLIISSEQAIRLCVKESWFFLEKNTAECLTDLTDNQVNRLFVSVSKRVIWPTWFFLASVMPSYNIQIVPIFRQRLRTDELCPVIGVITNGMLSRWGLAGASECKHRIRLRHLLSISSRTCQMELTAWRDVMI
jgi:hypothetical protein